MCKSVRCHMIQPSVFFIGKSRLAKKSTIVPNYMPCSTYWHNYEGIKKIKGMRLLVSIFHVVVISNILSLKNVILFLRINFYCFAFWLYHFEVWEQIKHFQNIIVKNRTILWKNYRPSRLVSFYIHIIIFTLRLWFLKQTSKV